MLHKNKPWRKLTNLRPQNVLTITVATLFLFCNVSYASKKVDKANEYDGQLEQSSYNSDEPTPVKIGIINPVAAPASIATPSDSNQPVNFDTRPWSTLFFVGATAKQQLGQLIGGEYHSANETLYSAELAYALNKENMVRRFLRPVVGVVQVAANLAYRDERKTSSSFAEGDLYFVFRWVNWPWDNYLTTTFAAGEGISYTSRVPYVETHDATAHGSQRLLNYLVFEITFALPSHPEWQLVGRIHHRSTAYGVFGNSNGGSNTVGLGIRYLFSI